MGKNQSASNLTNIVKYDNNGNLTFVSGSSTLLSVSSSGALTTTSTITATTLIVQTITSSISAITGSTKFGTLASNTHQFTGSMFITGSVGINQSNPSYTLDITGTGRFNGNGVDIFTSSGLGTSAASGLLRVITAGTTSGIAVGQANSSRYTSILANEFVIFNDDASIRTNGAFPISLGTNNTGRLFITSAGDVSIGTNTTNTNTKVKIKASSEGTGIGLSSSTLSIVRAATDTFLSIGYYSTPDAFVLSTSYGADGAYKPIAFATSDTERMRIFASGNVRFSSQVYNNTVASPRTLYIASDGELGGISSIRESKTNIAELDSNWLMQLNPVSFNYRKKDEDGKYTDEYYDELFYGLIAEETELINKEICTYNDDKLVGIEYSKLVPVLVKAIQELKAEIDELKNNK
jgi:hypothetical protein